MADDPFRAPQDTEAFDIPVFGCVLNVKLTPLPGHHLIADECTLQLVVLEAPKEGMD